MIHSTLGPDPAVTDIAQARIDDIRVEDLRAEGRVRELAVERLHTLLVRAARFEVARRLAALPALGGDELDDIAQQAADDALVSVLRRLDDFRGESRFTTWAYKFALLEAAVKLRRRGCTRAGAVDRFRGGRPDAARDRGAEGAARATPAADRRRADAAPAPDPRRDRVERGADRRAGGAPQHHPRSPVQDVARCAAEVARASGGGS